MLRGGLPFRSAATGEPGRRPEVLAGAIQRGFYQRILLQNLTGAVPFVAVQTECARSHDQPAPFT
jgi:hypothetical protein